jgi:hypothetical protein
MRFRVPHFRLLSLVMLLSLIPGASSPTRATVQDESASDSPAMVKAPYEVRLRKLHLVRPDLIPYPIFFEVYC